MFGAFDYDEDGFRNCSVTGLRIHKSAEDMVKLFGVTAVVAMLIGGIGAIFVVMTRWEAVNLLSLNPNDFYKILSTHAWNLLVFWMVFMEIAILYVGGPYILGRKLVLKPVAILGYVMMLVGAIMVNIFSWTTLENLKQGTLDLGANQAPLLTSYFPLPSPPNFYLGVDIFLFGALVAAVPFLATIYLEKRENPNSTLPLVAFGAFVASIIAAEAIIGGLITYIPAYLWRAEWIQFNPAWFDAAWYRQMYWLLGHGSQQINLVAMVTVWYFMTHVVGGAEVASEKVSRIAFVLYLFFINLGSAHHLLVDPGLSTGWKIWNASYAAYGAAFASMIHAFAIPAGLEVGRRKRGKGGGTFGWLWSAPWRDPGFSAVTMSVILFGFLGGITGVMMGQLQLNMTWHNTLAVPGHFHSTVAVGTTLAFMGLTYWVLKLVFGYDWVLKPLAVIQPYLYASTMGITALMLMYMGVLYGIPRRHPSVMNIPGTEFSFSAAQPLMVIFAIAALFAITAGSIFVLIAVLTLLVGAKYEGDLPVERPTAAADGGRYNDKEHHLMDMRGAFIFVLVFLGTFVLMYALNWYLVGQLWNIGG